MRPYRPVLGLAYLVFCTLTADAVDLTKIERVIAKEPKYQGKPTYCLLVFGPEAKLRVWLVLDGQTLYIDRNGNGDVTEPGERVERVSSNYPQSRIVGFRPGAVGTPDGKLKYKLTQLRKYKEGHCDVTLFVETEGRYSFVGLDGPGPLRFSDRPQDAPVIHFLGPLTLQRFDPQAGSASPHLTAEPLVRGQSWNLAFSLGTPGLGNGTFAKYPYSDGLPDAQAEVRFPNGKTVTASLKPDL